MTDLEVPTQPALHRSALVAREFVQRLGPTQVLLTDVRQSGPDAFHAAAQWPRTHAPHGRAAAAGPDALLVAETLRQLGIYLPLRYYGVAPDARLLIEELRFALAPDAERLAECAGPEITCSAHADRGGFGFAGLGAAGGGETGRLRNLNLHVQLLSGGREFARADGVARILSPAAYRAVCTQMQGKTEYGEDVRLRPVDPERVGVGTAHEVLVGVDRRGAVRIAPTDPHHPFYFDHPSDHITGMILIGAVQQTAALQANEPELRLKSCTLRALRFTEPSPPASVEIGPAGRFEIKQRGTVTATGEAVFGL